MGKHDIRTATSSEEHLMNRIKELEKKLVFANETIKKLQEQCGRMSKWASEIEANAQDKLAEKDAEIALLNEKIAKLVRLYV